MKARWPRPVSPSPMTLLSASMGSVASVLLSVSAYGHNTIANRSSYLPSKVLSSCDEPGLRDAIANATSGDVIDLAACSAITLTTGEIHVVVDDLTLQGPGAALLTIGGGAADGRSNRIFDHTGIGTLSIQGMTLADAHYVGLNIPEGGCIYSSGQVKLTDAVVTGCLLEVPALNPAYAAGGGVYAREGVTLVHSTVTRSTAYSALRGADGGGIFSHGPFSASYSTISNNTAFSLSKYSSGGGVVTLGAGDFALSNSSLFGNTSTDAAALHVRSSGSASIASSTISNNFADRYIGGAAFLYDVTVSGSTIADNRAGFTNLGVGLYSAMTATLRSSIVASNFAGIYSSDLSAQAVDGGQNIIMTSTTSTPFDTIHACPGLAPLADNGGPTLTQMPRSWSFALNTGGPLNATVDQRGSGYVRVYNGLADIGAVEWQGEVDDLVFVSRFELSCD